MIVVLVLFTTMGVLHDLFNWFAVPEPDMSATICFFLNGVLVSLQNVYKVRFTFGHRYLKRVTTLVIIIATIAVAGVIANLTPRLWH